MRISDVESSTTYNLGNTTFAGTLTKYIDNADSQSTVNATGATFGGQLAGSGLTPAQAFPITAKIDDIVDFASTHGKVVLKTGNIYVNNFNLIQAGVNAADAVASPGTPDTVNVQPTSSLIGGVIAATYSQTGTTVTVTTPAAHVWLLVTRFLPTLLLGTERMANIRHISVSANDFTYESASFTTSGNVNDYQCCLWKSFRLANG